MNISIIVGLGNNNEIGKGNDIPWYLPADLKYFKQKTIGHPIIMGRKCYESIGRPLPKRTNIIVTRNPEFEAEGCITAFTLDAAIQLAKAYDTEEIFIIGGGEIYKEGLSLASRIYITYIDIDIPNADVFFPALDTKEWSIISEEAHTKDAKNPYDYTFTILERNSS